MFRADMEAARGERAGVGRVRVEGGAGADVPGADAEGADMEGGAG